MKKGAVNKEWVHLFCIMMDGGVNDYALVAIVLITEEFLSVLHYYKKDSEFLYQVDGVQDRFLQNKKRTGNKKYAVKEFIITCLS